MNFWCISTIICVIVIMALIFTNLMEEYVSKNQQNKSQQQLNEFRNEANKTKQELEILLNLAMQNVGHSRRQRREASDFYGHLPESLNNEKTEEEQMVSNRNLDICNNENCGKVRYSDRLKYYLKPEKELNNFLSSLIPANKKITREISSLESEPNFRGENAWENADEKGTNAKEENNFENKTEYEIAIHQKNIKEKSKAKNGMKGIQTKKFSWPQNEEKNKVYGVSENLQKNANFFKLNTINSDPNVDYTNDDVSSCEHCSQHVDNGMFNNKSQSQKYLKKVSKQPKKLVDHQSFLKSFEAKYSIADPQDSDEDEEEDDNLYQIKYPSVILTRSQQDNENQKNECKPIGVVINKDNSSSSLNASQIMLNDQLENTKNNLSHEANYKLSKDEQDASENKKGYSWKWSIFKRSHPFNAMNEIKLKTSRRLMQRGFGASLPSYSLGETRKDLLIDKMLRRKQKEMLQEKDRTFQNFDERFANNFRDTTRDLDYSADPSFEKVTASRPLIDWSLNRQKRISDTNARYKREQHETLNHGENKAFNKSILHLETNLNFYKYKNNLTNNSLKAPKAEVAQISNEINYSLKAKSNQNDNYLRAFTFNKNLKAHQRADKYKDIGDKTIRVLTMEGRIENQAKETEPILNSDNLVRTSSDLKLHKYYFSNYKHPRRKKRSIQRNILPKESLTNKNQKLALNKSNTYRKQKKFNKCFGTKCKYSVRPARAFKNFPRIRRFNPFKTLQLHIYKNFHTPSGLKHRNLKAVSNKNHFKHYVRIRKKRSLQPSFLTAKNSACNENLISTVSKTIWQKIRFIKKHIQDFVKKSKTSSSNIQDSPIKDIPTASSKAFNIEKTQPKPFEVTNEKVANEGVKSDNSKTFNKIRYQKLRFLESSLSRLLIFKQEFKSLIRQTLEGLNISMKSNCDELNLNNFKSSSVNKTERENQRSYLEIFLDAANAKISFLKKVFNSSQLNSGKCYLNFSKSFFQKKNNITNTAENFSKKLLNSTQSNENLYNADENNNSKYTPALSPLNGGAYNPAKTVTYNNSNISINAESLYKNFSKNVGSFNTTKVFETDFFDDKNLTVFKEKLSSFNESSDYKHRQKRAFEIEKRNLNQTLALNKSLTQQSEKQDFEKRNLKRKRDKSLSLNKSFELNIHDINNHKNSIKSFKLNGKPKTFTRNLKRSKRSLNKNLKQDRFKSDKVKHLKKRSYFFHHDDLYKPDFNTDFPYKEPTNPENYLIEPQKIFSNQALSIDQERAKSFTRNNFDKLFNPQELDNLKTNYPTIQKFKGMEFDNLYLDNKSCKRNDMQKKRFVKTKGSRIKSRKLKNTHKRGSSDYLKNYSSQNKTQKTDLISTKLPSNGKYLGDLTHLNNNYKFNENMFNWSNFHPKTHMNLNNTSMDDSEKLSLKLRDEILNCKAFASLEEFIKSLPKNLTQSLLSATTESSLDASTETIEMDINTSIVSTELVTTEGPFVAGSTIKCSTTTEGENFDEYTETATEPVEDFSQPDETNFEQTSESGSQDGDVDISTTDSIWEHVTTDNAFQTAHDDVKLNITIKANVHGKPKENLYYGNGSFNIIPSNMDDRKRRHTFLSPFGEIRRRDSQKNSDIAENNEELNDLMSGKLSSKIVNNILSTVQQSQHLKALWPSLKHNQLEENKVQPNFYAIRNQQTEKQLQSSEKLLDQVMSSINTIIEQQAREQACVPLRPDLQEFYDMILQSRQQQDMAREKRHLTAIKKSKDSSYKIHLLDPTKIEQETKIVKKLLKKYDELPQEDQQQVAAARDDLIKNLIVLRQLQDKEEQQERESREKREHAWDVSDEDIMKSLQSEYSPEFVKLLNAAELYREINSD